MHGAFDDNEPGRMKPQRDTELTLSSTTLLGIFFGMVLLCGLFFGLGFAVGRYGPSDSVSGGQVQAAGGAAAAMEGGSKPKPSPTAQFVPQPQHAAVNVPVESASSAANEPAYEPGSNADSLNQQPQVRPALPPASYGVAPQPAVAMNVQPALAAGSLMVQIAAVMHPEDAEVLVGALRKRGYAVSVRRLPTDSLIHVQIGPFTSRDEAYRWRQRLLNDGYNAIVQP